MGKVTAAAARFTPTPRFRQIKSHFLQPFLSTPTLLPLAESLHNGAICSNRSLGLKVEQRNFVDAAFVSLWIIPRTRFVMLG